MRDKDILEMHERIQSRIRSIKLRKRIREREERKVRDKPSICLAVYLMHLNEHEKLELLEELGEKLKK